MLTFPSWSSTLVNNDVAPPIGVLRLFRWLLLLSPPTNLRYSIRLVVLPTRKLNRTARKRIEYAITRLRAEYGASDGLVAWFARLVSD